jgi:uncharacterized protein (UPF0147 family)
MNIVETIMSLKDIPENVKKQKADAINTIMNDFSSNNITYEETVKRLTELAKS